MGTTPDTAQVDFLFSGSSSVAGAKAQFSLYVRDAVTPWDAGQLAQLAAYGDAWWTTGKNGGVALRTLYSNQWTLDKVVCRDLDAPGGLVVEDVVGTPGTKVTDPPPPSFTLLVQFFGDAGGTPRRGWVNVNSGEEADFAGQDWTTAHRNAVLQAFNDWRIDLNDPTAGGDVNWAQVIVSRSLGTVVDPTPKKIAVPRATNVTNTLANTTTRKIGGSQRDRRAD